MLPSVTATLRAMTVAGDGFCVGAPVCTWGDEGAGTGSGHACEIDCGFAYVVDSGFTDGALVRRAVMAVRRMGVHIDEVDIALGGCVEIGVVDCWSAGYLDSRGANSNSSGEILATWTFL